MGSEGDVNNFSLLGILFLLTAGICFSLFIGSLNSPDISYETEDGDTCYEIGSNCVPEFIFQLFMPLGLLGTILYGFSGWALYKNDLSKLVFWLTAINSFILLFIVPIGTLVGILGAFKLYTHKQEFY